MVPNLDRTFDRVEAVAKALSLPFDKAAQRKSFFGSLKAPETLVSALKTDGPLAIVALPAKQAGKKQPEVVIAVQGKSPEDLRTAITGMGAPIATKDDAKSYKVDAETVWLVQRGSTLVAAQSLESLVLGAAMAMEAAQGSDDDLKVLVSPEAIAKGQGTDLKTATAGLLATWADSLKSTAGQNPMAEQVLGGMLKPVADRLAEVEQAGLSFRLDAEKGATLRLEATPRKDSKLASLFGMSTPAKLDTRVVPEATPIGLTAFSRTNILTTMWAELRPLVARDKDGEDAAKQIDVVLQASAFGGSAAMAVVDKQMRVSGVYGMRNESDGEAFLSAASALMKGAWYQSLLSKGGMKAKVSVKRDKDVVLVSTAQAAPKDLPPAMAEAMKGIGMLSQTMAMLAKQGSLFFASGKDAAAKVRQLASSEPRKLAGVAATAVQESSGSDGFFYMDFGPLLMLGAEAMGAGDNPMLANMTLPFWLSYRAGKSPSLELRVPMEVVRGKGALLPMLMGMGAGLGGVGPTGP